MVLFKREEQLVNLEKETYFLAFSDSSTCSQAVNFKSRRELNRVLRNKGIISLFNDWLEDQNVDFEAMSLKDVGFYYVGVVESTFNHYYDVKLEYVNVV